MSLQSIFAATLTSPVARAFIASSLITLPGCAVTRQGPAPAPTQTPSASRGDSAITQTVKAKFERNTTVDANAIDIVTRNGVVTLSGAARSSTERTMAETLARTVGGVRSVTNEIVISH